MISRLRNEMFVVKQNMQNISNVFLLLFHPSFQVMFHYRIAYYLYQKKRYVLANYISYLAFKKTGVRIHPNAKIGRNCFIKYGVGTIIEEDVIIGDNVTIMSCMLQLSNITIPDNAVVMLNTDIQKQVNLLQENIFAIQRILEEL